MERNRERNSGLREGGGTLRVALLCVVCCDGRRLHTYPSPLELMKKMLIAGVTTLNGDRCAPDVRRRRTSGTVTDTREHRYFSHREIAKTRGLKGGRP